MQNLDAEQSGMQNINEAPLLSSPFFFLFFFFFTDWQTVTMKYGNNDVYCMHC
jgi:hypothetical protein